MPRAFALAATLFAMLDAACIRSESARWGKAVKDCGAKVD